MGYMERDKLPGAVSVAGRVLGGIAAALLGLTLLAGCAEPEDERVWLEAGCRDGEPRAREVKVKKAYDCPGGSRVVTFRSKGDKGAYLAAMEPFGFEVLEQGDLWVRVKV